MNTQQRPEPQPELPQTQSLVEEQVRQLYNNIPLSLSVSFVLQCILTFAHFKVIGHGDLILWNVLMLCVMLVRAVSWFIWRNPFQSIQAEYWLSIFRAGAWFAGLIWGTSAYFMFAEVNPAYQALLAFTLAGVASGSLTTLSIDRKSAAIFVILVVTPLSFRLLITNGPVATPMLLMSVMFILFVITASSRARAALENQFNTTNQLIELNKERLKIQQLSKAINRAQEIFISQPDSSKAFAQILEDALSISQSKFGFIGEVFFNDQHQPYLKMLSLTNVAWDRDSQLKWEQNKIKPIEFHNLNSLFGAALLSRKPIISNFPSKDMRSSGTPEGHPELTSFLGLPILNGDQLVALIGLANKEDGYNEEIIEFLEPFLKAVAQIIVNLRHQRQHNEIQEKLKVQIKHTETVVSEAFDAIITINQLGRITSCNKAAETIFGYTAAQMIGENVSLLMPEQDKSAHDSYLQRYQNSGQAKIIGVGRKVRGLRKNGKEFPIELAVVETTIDNEKLFIGFARDISEQEKLETLKNQFIQTVSHELRTPLTSISASLSLLENGTLGKMPDNVKNLVRIAFHNSQRLQRLINDLLDMDKLIGNQIELFPQLNVVHKLIQKSIQENQAAADRQSVQLRILDCDSSLQIFADEARVLQILNHLLSNAIKFSTSGQQVEITAEKKRNSVRISIKDSGTGIAPEFHQHLFTRFSQADATASRHKDGTGLGLAISKQLVEKMNGSIGFTTQLGKGSCFYIDLPIHAPI